MTPKVKELKQYIQQRKKEMNATIVAHYYQPPEIQDIADFVGDSLQLAQEAAATNADVIISCGVKFMAETAKILSPNKTVLLPDINAGCPMADMVNRDSIKKKKAEYPGALVVSYVNTTAEVKAESFICCTSSNAIDIIKSLPLDREIIFVPDKNLGKYIETQSKRKMHIWLGYCPVHDLVNIEELEKQIAKYPKAKVVVHPECPPQITERADAVRSTSGILKYVMESNEEEFIIGTEEGFLYTLEKHCPNKKFYLARQNFLCEDMKYISLEKLAKSMELREHQIEVEEEIRLRAYLALDRMLGVGMGVNPIIR